MKVLQVNKLYAPWVGGVETVARDIASGLSMKDGIYIENLVCQSRGSYARDIIDGVLTHRAKSFGVFMGMPISLQFFSLFRKMARDVDVILIHHPFPLACVAYWLFGRRKQVVVWYHSDIVRQKITRIFFQPFLLFMLRRARYIFVSNSRLVSYSPILKKFSDSCRVIYFGLKPEAYAQTPEIVQKAQDIRNTYGTPLILGVGRLIYYKGFEYLIRSIVLVPSVHVLIIGSGVLHDKLISLAAHLGVSDRVHIIPSLISSYELVPYYYACDIFAFPSCGNGEVFGITQAEAMMCGRCVVNTDLPTGVPEVSVDGETGITVPIRNVEGFAKAITTLLNDDVLREKYAQAAYQKAHALFIYTRFIDEVEKYLKTM